MSGDVQQAGDACCRSDQLAAPAGDLGELAELAEQGLDFVLEGSEERLRLGVEVQRPPERHAVDVHAACVREQAFEHDGGAGTHVAVERLGDAAAAAEGTDRQTKEKAGKHATLAPVSY